MPAISITAVPVSFATALGVTLGPRTSALYTCQNLSPTETVYRQRAASQPDTSTATGAAFTHVPGETWAMIVLADDPTWLWVEKGSATVVVEDGSPYA